MNSEKLDKLITAVGDLKPTVISADSPGFDNEDTVTITIDGAKPKQPTNHQHHGYSRRKAKRAYQTRCVYKLKVRKFWAPLTSYFQSIGTSTSINEG